MKKFVFLIIVLFNINVLASTSTMVIDNNSGRILYQDNAYEKRLIASTTKIMTFVVAYEYAKDYLDLEIEVGDEILKMYGTSIYLSLHEKMKLRDLLYGLMMRSGNDAAIVIANFVGGSEEGFVKLMNKKARFIGMNNTIFNNPHGLDENTKNYSTAYDMALLSKYANTIRLYQKITSTKYYDVKTNLKSYSWINRNKLVFTYPFFISGKTGYTPSAGKTLVSTAKKDNLEITIVTLDDNNHYANHINLYNKMFDKYKNYLLVSCDSFNLEHNDLYLKEDIYYPLANDEKNNIDIKLMVNDLNSYVSVALNEKEVLQKKVYKKEKNTNNVNSDIWQKFKKFIHKFF